MFIEKAKNNYEIKLIEGYDRDKKKIVTSIITDGEIEEIDHEYNSSNEIVLEKNKDTRVQRIISSINNLKKKRIKVKNFSYISVYYYILIESSNEWMLYSTKNIINENFNILDELNFIKCYQTSQATSFAREIPDEKTISPLNPKVKAKKFIKHES